MSLKVVPKAPAESVVVPFRAYDVPDLTPIQFLQECMHSSNIALALRVEAANKLLKLGPPEFTVVMVDNDEPVIKYIIGGRIPS